MKLLRLILPDWALNELPERKKVLEGLFSDQDLVKLNSQGYNVYYLPNYPKDPPDETVKGSHIDMFKYVFVDCDLKDKVYEDKESFILKVMESDLPPTRIVDSGNGVHAYWKVSNLDAMSYLRFQRRLIRLFNTDQATGQIFQLMRLPGTINTKVKANPIPCETLFEGDAQYSAEELDKLLPAITKEDENFCQNHYDRTYNLAKPSEAIASKMPEKFGRLLRDNKEVKAIWSEDTDDRSKNDYRLGHLMFANGFTRGEAITVLGNTAKALKRAPVHQQSYAENIVDKIWTFELAEDDKARPQLSMSVKEVLLKSPGGTLKGTPFRCHKRIDNTVHGYRLGQVLGLVAGSGVGKTAFALNMFRWFTQNNPEYHHFFVPLEQPANEIADRWATMSGTDTSLHDKVHIISNYDDDGNFRHLSFSEIKDYIKEFSVSRNVQVGCVVIDHIGALKKKGAKGENQDIMDICHEMKAFAVQTNTFLIMQSQSSREKAGIGDLELNKDAAYGTVYFESYCDYLVTLWQPLKRCHDEASCPTVTAFKFCKIRHKKAKKDVIKEDVCYWMYFDSETELMRDLTQDEIVSFNYFVTKATNKRKADRKTEIVSYQSVPYKETGGGESNAIQTTTRGDRVSARH